MNRSNIVFLFLFIIWGTFTYGMVKNVADKIEIIAHEIILISGFNSENS